MCSIFLVNDRVRSYLYLRNLSWGFTLDYWVNFSMEYFITSVYNEGVG